MTIIRFLVLLFICWHADATTYYVGKNIVGASDSNAGTDPLAPWLTMQKAGTTASSGDVVREISGATYLERVTISNNGAKFIGLTGSTVLGFQSTGKNDYSIIGFEITHPGAESYEAIRVDGGSNVQIIDNYIHDVGAQGIRPGNTFNLLIRGNVIDRCGQGSLPEIGSAGISSLFGKNDTNTIIEYNLISHTSDYINPFGTGWIVRNNVFGPCYTNATVHIDGIQANAKCDLGLMEANISVDNNSSDNHFYLNQIDDSTNWVIRGNVTIRTKGVIDFTGAPKQYFYHNSFINTLVYYDSDFQVNITGNSNCWARNNIWWKAVKSTPGPYTPNANINDDWDIWYQSGTQTQPNGLSSDPLIVSTNDAHIQVTSPAIGAAGGVTLANGLGSSSTNLIVTAGTSGMFYSGDNIKIGSSSLVGVASVNLVTDTITLSSARSWNSNDNIFWEERTDIGALPYSSLNLTSANYTKSGNNYSVNINGDSRGIWFYENGIPISYDSTAPYEYTSSGGVVVAKAYALYAQENPVVVATLAVVKSINHGTITHSVTLR